MFSAQLDLLGDEQTTIKKEEQLIQLEDKKIKQRVKKKDRMEKKKIPQTIEDAPLGRLPVLTLWFCSIDTNNMNQVD